MLRTVVTRSCIALTRFLCISPVLPVKVLDGVEVTVGGDDEDGGKWPYAGTSAVIGELGKHIKKDSVTVSNLCSNVAPYVDCV